MGVVSIDRRFGFSAVFPEMEESSGSGGDGISVLQVSGFHGGRLYSDTVLLGVKEESDITGMRKLLVLGVLWNDAVFVVELHVPEAELDGAPV